MSAEAKRLSSTVFSTRPAGEVASSVTSSAHASSGLDWQAFSAAYFPGRRRHDLEALAAYGAHRRSHSGSAPVGDEPVAIAPGRGTVGTGALRNWENEGGATLSPHGP
jgi:hypothetical protein